MKKNLSLVLASLVLALGYNALPFAVSTAYAETEAAAPTPAKTETVRPAMGKPLNEIQELLAAKQYPQALEKINALESIENKTPYEIFAIDRMRAVVASGTNNTELLATSFEGMLKSNFLQEPEQLRLIEAMAGTYFNEKKYDLSKQWALRYLAKDNTSQPVHSLMARTMYLQNDFAGATKELKQLIAADQDAKRTPNNDNLRLLGNSYQQLKDDASYIGVLELLVTYYPKKEYWGDLIYRVERKPGFSDRLRLDLYRLLLKTNNIEDSSQFVEMAELALLAGLPLEAQQAVDAGYAANILGQGKDAAKHKQLRDKANKQAADDAKTLDAGEAAAKSSKNGTGMVNMGYNYVIRAQYDKGLALMNEGIAKGGLKAPEEAKLHLGMAYLQSGDKAKAAEIFKTVQGNDGSADIARLWMLMK